MAPGWADKNCYRSGKEQRQGAAGRGRGRYWQEQGQWRGSERGRVSGSGRGRVKQGDERGMGVSTTRESGETFPTKILNLEIYWGISPVKSQFRPDVDPLEIVPRKWSNRQKRTRRGRRPTACPLYTFFRPFLDNLHEIRLSATNFDIPAVESCPNGRPITESPK